MIKEWVITNKGNSNAAGLAVRGKNYYVYAPEEVMYPPVLPGEEIESLFLLLEGFVLPRREFENRFTNLSQEELILTLYREHRDDFIRFIKGNFIILIGEPRNGFSLHTDQLGIKKVFYYHNPASGEFVLSNRFGAIAGRVDREPDITALAVKSLTHHYLGGLTFLKDIRCSGPASYIHFNSGENKLIFDKYWDCTQLLDRPVEDIPPMAMAEYFKSIIKGYLAFLQPGKVSVTLTGGLDSRTILAALLSLGRMPYTFTYGHPQSIDAVTAQEVAGAVNLKHHTHHVPPSAGWFAERAEEIVDKGNAITHLHRAHRLESIKKETRVHPDSEMILGGYMGGESIRNFYYDELIVPEFSRRWLNKGGDKKQLINDSLDKKFLKWRELDTDVDAVYDILKTQRYFQEEHDLKLNEFFMTILLLAGVHHAQDPNLFSHYIKYPVPVYMDIDFLDLVFRSRYNFLHIAAQPGGKMTRLMNRLKGAELYCHFIDAYSPELANIPFAKRGFYTPREYVKHSPAMFAAKRTKRRYLNKIKGPVNFGLGKWMEDFVRWRLNSREGDTLTPTLYDIPGAKAALNDSLHPDKEFYWRKFTDITWTQLAIKRYMA